MIRFILNNEEKTFNGDETISLLNYLREIEGIVSVKDGCSGQGACGACLTEINGEPALSCRTPIKKVNDTRIVTIEGFEPGLKEILGTAFVKKGAVQCGFCTPGFISRTKILLSNNPDPSREEVIKALVGTENVAASLRSFELEFLSLLGYAVNLHQESGGHDPLQVDRYYQYRMEQGLVVVDRSEGALVFEGSVLVGIAEQRFDDPNILRAANRLLREIISFHLGGKELKSRKVLMELHRGRIAPSKTRN